MHVAVTLFELLLHVLKFLEIGEFAAGIVRAPEPAIDHGQLITDHRIKRLLLDGMFQERPGLFRLVDGNQRLCQAESGIDVIGLQLECS